MSRISSTTLFNFTDSLELLIDNLRNGIYCHTIYEKLPVRYHGYKVPMACFCDIPLSLIKEHFDWYGRYGLGIKRSYARSHGVKPVWYVTSENQLVKNLVKSDALSDYELKHLLPYLKQFMGNQFYPKTQKERRKKFYDEREWRYLPDPTLIQTVFGPKAHQELRDESTLEMRMQLDLDQLEYIIIEKEEDLEPMLDSLKEISALNGVRYEGLVAKMMTSKQIERDF